jgi:hypothetical protein
MGFGLGPLGLGLWAFRLWALAFGLGALGLSALGFGLWTLAFGLIEVETQAYKQSKTQDP